MIKVYLGKKHFFLHPYFPSKISYKNKEYSCIWCAYVAQKYNTDISHFSLRQMMIYENTHKIKNNEFEKNKFTLMTELYETYFYSYKDAMDKLMSTKNQYIEFSFGDGEYYWGSYNGVGENKIGEILMNIRSKEFSERKKRNLKRIQSGEKCSLYDVIT